MIVLNEAFKQGIGEELPYWGVLKGFDIMVIPDGLREDGTTYMRMEHMSGGTVVEYQLAPQEDTPNPLVIIEADENGDINVKPVIGRMTVSTEIVLIPVGHRGDFPLKASFLQVDVQEEGAIISMNESLNIDPIFGEYDNAAYNFIRRKSYEELRLGYIASFARDYLAA
jgi:hypothetical protein